VTDPLLPPPSGAYPPVPPAAPAPFGVPPAGSAPQYPAPHAPSFPTPPQQYSAPMSSVPQAPPPGAYQVPVGGYAAPLGEYVAPDSLTKKSGLLGTLALILAVIAAIVVPIVAGIAGFEIGTRIPSGIDTTDPDLLSVLSPARDQVLWAEIAFWTGTVLGIAAIVTGIAAIVKKQRRGLGITALILAVLGAAGYWIVLVIAISVGTATGLAA
jgi:hypothetical protein